jgi:DNA-binding FadR family transcriptional regulator
MEYKQIVSPTMKELFIDEIERKIISGELQPGDKLPTERELEKLMKVSKTIIHSGLSELAAKGFVEVIPRTGTFVSDYTRTGNLGVLSSITRFNHGKLDKKTFESLMTFRLNMDQECAALAALNRKDFDLELLQKLLDQIMICEDYEEMALLKVNFSHAMYCATGNTIYPLVVNSFHQLSLTFNKIVFRHYGYQMGRIYMEELMDAILHQKDAVAKEVAGRFLKERIGELNEWYFKDV